MAENWVGWPSEYPWEQEALDHVRSFVEGAPGYWAMSSFSFTGLSGRTRECDLIVVAPSGLHLIEIKSHRGTAVNQGTTWYFDRGRPVENPQALLEQKCKELKALLLHQADRAGVRLPGLWITGSTFLSAPDLKCEFAEHQKRNVYGREGVETGLPGIWTGLLGRPPTRNRLKPADAVRIAGLLRPAVMGIPRQDLEVGAYRLERAALEEGPTWRDHLAVHTSLGDGRLRRVRIYTAQAESAEERGAIDRAALREYRALQGIHHPGIVGAEYFDGSALEEGPAIVFEHGAQWTRLDEYLRGEGRDRDLDTRVFMIRQLADALAHAHGHRLYHRSLAARSVWVEHGRYPRLRITDWQTASLPTASGSGRPATSMRALAAHLEPAAGPYLAPELAGPDVDKPALDVFGLGAVAYAIAVGEAPAESRLQLRELVAAENGLNLQSRFDDIPDELNDLIARATRFIPIDRTASVQDFSADLDRLEAALATADDPDPLHAKPGESLGPFIVRRVLGTGSFGRALLVERSGEAMVLKVALDGKVDYLRREAAYLRQCNAPLIIKLLDDPIGLPHGRTGLLLEYAGAVSLGEQLRMEGSLSRDELRRYADDLFSILRSLEDSAVRHRDVKPDNLGLREVGAGKPPRLTLFDFSLASDTEPLAEQDDSDAKAGTHGYLDPYLGQAGRDRNDAAAERYAVAATLYAMATGEDPGQLVDIGDGRIEPAIDLFDPSLKDGLTRFFKRAFESDVAERHSDRVAMQNAFFKAFEEEPPPPPEPVRTAAEEIGRDTPLRLTGLDIGAVSAAETKLSVVTVGDLIDQSAKRIARARGVGRNARNLLLRERKRWIGELPDAVVPSSRRSARGTEGEADEGPLPVDVVAEQFIPEQSKDPQYVRILKLYFGLSEEQLEGERSLWLSDAEICREAGATPEKLAASLESGHGRLRSGKVKGVGALQQSLLEGHTPPGGERVPGIIERHGRIMPVSRLAAALLEERGAVEEDDSRRTAYAAACVRAVMMVEERKENPRFEIVSGLNDTWLAALASQNEDEPTEDELRDWARRLAAAAEDLVRNVGDGGPLPTSTEARAVFASDAMDAPKPRPVMSDRDLFELACRATTGIGLTPRLELYPTALPAARAVRIAGIASRLREPTPVGLLVDQIRLRFPALEAVPAGIAPSEFEKILRDDCDLPIDGDRLAGTLWLPEQLSTVHRRPGMTGRGTPAAEVDPKLDAAAAAGGFLAVRTSVPSAGRILEKLAARPEVTPVNVTELYVKQLRSARDAMAAARNGKPTWETVLKAAAADAPPNARENLRQLSLPAWEALRRTVTEAGGTAGGNSHGGIVLLHDAAPLARLAGGMEVLQELIASARQRSGPFGLWLMCPMWNIERGAALDGVNVGALEVDNEQLPISSEYLNAV